MGYNSGLQFATTVFFMIIFLSQYFANGQGLGCGVFCFTEKEIIWPALGFCSYNNSDFSQICAFLFFLPCMYLMF